MISTQTSPRMSKSIWAQWSRRQAFFSGFALFALVTHAGCAPKPAGATFNASAEVWGNPPPYVLQPGDDVEIKFPGSPQMNEHELIRPDGKLNLPALPHPVSAANLTVPQLRDVLRQDYSAFMIDPNIEVLLRAANGNTVIVAGEVTQETVVQMTSPLTLSNAISIAHGMKTTAARTSVILMRQGPDGKTIARRINYNRIVDGSDPSQDIVLAAGDTIYVPQTWIGDIDDFSTQFRAALPIEAGVYTNYSFGPRSSR